MPPEETQENEELDVAVRVCESLSGLVGCVFLCFYSREMLSYLPSLPDSRPGHMTH